jgi:hypothetical protein
MGEQADHGTAVVNPDGSFTYSPDDGFTGTDTFTYQHFYYDPVLHITDGTVTITVVPEGTAPVGNDDSYDVDEDDTLVVDAPGVLGNDTGATGARLVSGVDHGDLDFNEDGSFAYIPDDDYNGTDEFTYVATNDVQVGQLGQSVGGLFTLDSEPVTVTLEVNAVPESGDGGDESDDDDSDDDGESDSDSDGSDDGDSDAAALPDAGSPIHPAALTWTVMLLLTGSALVVSTRRRGQHAA